MDPEKKKKFHPWEIEKSFTHEIGTEPATKRSNNESDFFIDISNEQEAKFFQLKSHYVLRISKKG